MSKENTEKKPLLVSACLLGINCKYSGGNNYSDEVELLKEQYQLIPVCPEQLGGLATPRCPAEIRGKEVVTKDGFSVTRQYQQGAEEVLKLAKILDCKCAVLKSGSPSCGSGSIYDGTFTSTKIVGDGVTSMLLKENDISVYTEEQLAGLTGGVN